MAVTTREHSDLPRTPEDVRARLERLLDRVAKGGFSGLTDRQVEDLGRLYRAAATELALLRGFGASTRKVEEVNRLVSRAHRWVYGRRKRRSLVATASWVVFALPATVRRTLRFHLLAFGLLLLGLVYGYLGAAADPEWALELLPATDQRTPYATRADLLGALHRGRAGEVGTAEKTAFATLLWTHNTQIAIFAFFLGVLGGVPAALLVLFNGCMLGVYTWIHHEHGLAAEWWAWILPHGVTELAAVCLLAGGGLWIGSLVTAPGEQSRTAALAGAVGDMTRLLLLAFPMLGLAALIESFVRQSRLGDPGRWAVAAGTAVLWALYLGLVRPPRAFARKLAAERSLADRAVPLPEDREILALARR